MSECLVNLRIIIFIYCPTVEARKLSYVLLVRMSRKENYCQREGSKGDA